MYCFRENFQNYFRQSGWRKVVGLKSMCPLVGCRFHSSPGSLQARGHYDCDTDVKIVLFSLT